MSIPRCVATGTALSVSSCILLELFMGDFDLVICITSHSEGLKAICQDCSQSICLLRSCCKLAWSVFIDFLVEHCIIGEKFEGVSWRNLGGRVIYTEKEEEGAKSSQVPNQTCILLPALLVFYWSEFFYPEVSAGSISVMVQFVQE